MKRLLIIFGLLMAFTVGTTFAQDSLQIKNQYRKGFQNHNKSMMQNQNTHHGMGFVDANGDGYNDNAPDADGDGIPNGMDPDYTGAKMRHGGHARGFVDADGDGINDNALDDDGDGIPNGQDPDYVRPQDGSGRMNGKGQMHGRSGNMNNGSGIGTGDCDGTGPKGNGRRGGKH